MRLTDDQKTIIRTLIDVQNEWTPLLPYSRAREQLITRDILACSRANWTYRLAIDPNYGGFTDAALDAIVAAGCEDAGNRLHLIMQREANTSKLTKLNSRRTELLKQLGDLEREIKVAESDQYVIEREMKARGINSPIKVFVATNATQGQRSDDFTFVPEGELLTHSFECNNPDCGCTRSLSGVDCLKATTTMKVIEWDGDLVAVIGSSLLKGEWDKRLPAQVLDETAQAWAARLVEEASEFEAGEVVGRGENGFYAREARKEGA